MQQRAAAMQQAAGCSPAGARPCCAFGRAARPSGAASTSVSPAAQQPVSCRRRAAGVARAGEGMSPGKLDWASSRFPGGLPLPPISRSDEEFLKLGVEFLDAREGIKAAELNELFEKVGFPRRDPDLLEVALANTHRLVWVRATKQSRVARLGQLLGFARATSDGVFNAVVWDVAVAPAWQRSGIGRGLMERLTRGLVEDGIPTIALYAEPKVVALYSKLGFKSDVDGIKGMAFQRREPGGGSGGAKRFATVGARR
ncbi:acetyltransferase [Raphidocelis subcapitata]|uniref:Acetyltransferase n=1 Tax=Raphidocelis subcapitata TaxID=307507 RepID=A0A2V0NX44_9CHLO|nr:acetyltransferase [Raphidocelis subcapitata]|eukprot:GBF91909.1 acetyltransferase [Raphidocelis subcapitata]